MFAYITLFPKVVYHFFQLLAHSFHWEVTWHYKCNSVLSHRNCQKLLGIHNYAGCILCINKWAGWWYTGL